jgi:hypothetical protein
MQIIVDRSLASPEAPSFITRFCGFGFNIIRRQIAQALDALLQVFGSPPMNEVGRCCCRIAKVECQRWPRNFGPLFKVDRLARKTILDDEDKELFSGV